MIKQNDCYTVMNKKYLCDQPNALIIINNKVNNNTSSEIMQKLENLVYGEGGVIR